MTAATTRRRLLAALAALFMLVVAGRTVFVSLYAESIPYWDQWDAEGANLIKPWLDGNLTVERMFAPHNEHRIVFTRLTSLGLLEANEGQWDNLVGAYANTFIYAVIPTLLFALFAPGLRTRAAKSALFLALLAFAWLPYALENTLIAFQNQFYFMSLFAIACIWIAAHARDDAWLPIKVLPAAALGIFSMASGLLAAMAAAGVLGLRLAALRDLRLFRGIVAIALLAVVAICGYAAIPHISGHESLKAHDAGTWLHHFISNLGWPLSENGRLAWILVWPPTAITAYRLVRRRRIDAYELAAFGMAMWALLQAAAIAFSRGAPSGRYLDTLCIGLVANIWLALRLFEQPASGAISSRRIANALPLAMLVIASAVGLAFSAPTDIRAAARRAYLSLLQTINVRQFVASGDRRHLDDKPPFHIPYPAADRLALLLADPTLRQSLPASIRAPLPLAAQSNGDGFQSNETNITPIITSCPDHSTCLDRTGTWESQPLATRFSYLQVPVEVDGAGEGQWLGLMLDGSDEGAPQREILTRSRLLLRVPAMTPFSLRAKDASVRSGLHFGAPLEVGRLSAWAMSFQDRIRALFGHATGNELHVFVESAVSASGQSPLKLDPLKLAQLEWRSPHTGKLISISALIGNYGGQSDGLLAMQACSPRQCRSAQAPLRDSIDNQYFVVRFDKPLELWAGDPIALNLWTHHSTNAVALWSSRAIGDSPRILHLAETQPMELTGKSLRVRLEFLD